ncbi:fasciclin domain-containing protein [Christiangramia sediminis]|uniref:Fasciclin domain-containing protein n=1 Tax=Christiangramia sediminis TaxID=2881336 RepID=A0A9X1LI31_9FLAO|nr:fasciclin domain-containing protein [Christiangramia sediminis]MCB7480790.1 fasciclin domain-containing protein [Christiangramia sediminis]
MNFILKNAKLTFLALLISFSFSACSEDDLFDPGGETGTVTPEPTPDPDPDPDPDDDGTAESNTIVDFVNSNDDYSSLGAALEAADLIETLDGDTEFTVFAPNNAAFDAFLEANGFATLEDVPTDLLTLVLMNHVQTGIVMSSDLSTGYIESMAEAGPDGENVSLYVDTSDGVVLNGMSTVTSADNEVDNGVIHAVDAVIGLPDVTTFATADPTFSSLATALTREELVTTLQSTDAPAPFTIFAPTDDAFTALLEDLEAESLDDIDSATLTSVLQYHVITEDYVTSDELTDGMVVTTLQGEDITINVDGDGNVSITDVNDGISTVVAADVQATNGVIHAIDMVLLPTLE